MSVFSQKIIIITAPSGAGKTSITKYLLHKFPQLSFSVSATTRKARNNEKDGLDYYFISPEDFQNKIAQNGFIEWEMVYEGKYYGTLKSEMERIWNNNQIPVLDIDVKGAIHVQQQFKEEVLSIFIEPPSEEALKKRLENRGTETTDNIATRLNKAAYEISFKNYFNKIIVNDVLDKACAEAEKTVADFLEK